MDRECLVCKTVFAAKGPRANAKTCSPECSAERRKQTLRAYQSTSEKYQDAHRKAARKYAITDAGGATRRKSNKKHRGSG